MAEENREPIVPKEWNDQFFEKIGSVLNMNDAVAAVLIAVNTPDAPGPKGTFLMQHPNVDREFLIHLLETALIQVKSGPPNIYPHRKDEKPN